MVEILRFPKTNKRLPVYRIVCIQKVRNRYRVIPKFVGVRL